MALRLLLPLLLLLLARGAGGLRCNQCAVKFQGVCLSSAKTCTATGGQVCSSATFSFGKVAVFSQYDCVTPESCHHNSSELLELSCCNTTLCNAAAPALPPALGLGLGALLGLWWPLR